MPFFRTKRENDKIYLQVVSVLASTNQSLRKLYEDKKTFRARFYEECQRALSERGFDSMEDESDDIIKELIAQKYETMLSGQIETLEGHRNFLRGLRKLLRS